MKKLMNSHYGSTLTNQQNFRNIKICSNREGLLKLTKKPEFNSFNIVNENLTVVELNKTKFIYDSPILIGTNILFNSKCNLYNYMYNINPKLLEKKIFNILCKTRTVAYLN